MQPDLVLLRDLIEASPTITAWRRGLPEAEISAVEAAAGPLPTSFRWWLAEFGGGAVGGAPLATAGLPDVDLVPRGDRLTFLIDEDEYAFALDRRSGGECPVVRRDHFTGEEDDFADTFAGFLTVRAALAAGLRDGPNPTIARLWRSTPGVLLPDGTTVYGPHDLPERNATFEVRRYAPDWTLVGDDGGGNGLFMRHHGRDRASVHLLDLGAIERDVAAVAEPVTDDLLAWLAART
ncbi:SMI1/KNR4 family protein [Actinomadura atramentaria]|uniref:SMI1/KNR4 family protein n=1 Tax=Actinomadura atramentaria TaxID=1990 RepID=UPI00036CB907|nr:SMI1/KNR4 family protein [Actinomadura atramentaria]